MSHFFAMLSRMKFIKRWSLMRNTSEESLCSHSYETAVIAHALCVIGNRRFGRQYNADRAAVIAMYHDASEIITGDLPTPIKYFNPEIKSAYKAVEKVADSRLISLLPEDLREDYASIFAGEQQYKSIVKAADKLSALIKCIEEQKMGNTEFDRARQATECAIAALDLPEAEVFMNEFLHSYSLSLDELN